MTDNGAEVFRCDRCGQHQVYAIIHGWFCPRCVPRLPLYRLECGCTWNDCEHV